MRGLTQKRLAEVAAIDERHVQRIEAGRANPRLATLWLLAGALGTTPSDLIAAGVASKSAQTAAPIPTR